jgi:hypothetical protein
MEEEDKNQQPPPTFHPNDAPLRRANDYDMVIQVGDTITTYIF